jgi:hypothetical protein
MSPNSLSLHLMQVGMTHARAQVPKAFQVTKIT